MNFTFDVKVSPDLKYGSIQSDGTWNGIVRELQIQNADIGKVCFHKFFDTIDFKQCLQLLHH